MANPNAPIEGDGINATPATIHDIQARAEDYKRAQEKLKGPAPIIFTGDDRAVCSSLFEAITSAKRAGIELLFLETNYRRPGGTGSLISWEGDIEHLSQAVYIAGKNIVITISAQGLLYWEDEAISPDDFLQRLGKYTIHDAPEKQPVHFTIRVEEQTDFSFLRYVADQIKRTHVINNITLELHRNKQP